MKIRRTLNRRDFRIATAGWFTLLRPAKQSAPRKVNLHPLVDRSGVVAPPSMMQLSTHDVRPKRTALIVSAALMITSLLLWWIMHP